MGLNSGTLVKNLKYISFFISVFAILAIIFEYGFDLDQALLDVLHLLHISAIISGTISVISRYIFQKKFPEIQIWLTDLFLVAFLVALLAGHAGMQSISFFDSWILLYFGIFIVFIREFSEIDPGRKLKYLNPAQIFVSGFFLLIVVGTILLMLPNATYTDISFIDALFTSTSAVCVTGLIVVDTGSFFTLFGQIVILLLMQLGGIGIMSFTSFFSYFFSGRSSFGSQLMLKDFTRSDRIDEVFKFVKVIILFTFLIEAIGAIFIYLTLNRKIFSSLGEEIFFSVFHSVSGFCNAGFSTLPEGLYQSGFGFNYNLHLVIAFLFITGGLGFPVILNVIRYFRHFLVNRILKKKALHIPWVISMNTRLVVLPSLILLVGGTLIFYFIEYDNTLESHQGMGKFVTAFFGAATPRTAGFNTIDTASLRLPSLLLVMMLMWIGAAPGSTGGGIKVTTLSVALLNILSLSRGKDRIDSFGREVSTDSVNRAFAVIMLSFVVIGSSVFILFLIEDSRELLPIVFECFSAYSTVGLSMGITGDLQDAGKLVIIFNMFTGRLSMLVILLALFRKVKHLNYRYPAEDIFIN